MQASQPRVLTADEEKAMRLAHEKHMEQFKPPSSVIGIFRRDPFIASGALLTVGILTAGVISMFRGQSSLSQKLMRARVVAQGVTVVAIMFSGWRLKKASDEYNEQIAAINAALPAPVPGKGDYVPSAQLSLEKNPAVLQKLPTPTPRLSTPTATAPVPVKQPINESNTTTKTPPPEPAK